jgi:adenine-specific DNA methylase
LAQLGKVRVTLPALGSGHGGLDWSRVSKMIQKHLEGLEAEIIVFDPADSRTIADTEVPGVGPETRVLAKGTPDFPNALTGFDCDEIHYQGDLTILKSADLTIALSSKPNQKEETAAIESIGELPKSGLTICLVLGNATATTLAATALENGNRVAAWVPHGLSQYHPPKALRIAPRCNGLLLLSLAKPQQSWNPRLADRTRLASLLTSKTALVTDPEPRWLRHLDEVSGDPNGTKIFYIRYQDSEARAEKDLRFVSAKPIGRKSGNGKPNLTPILDSLGSRASEESVADSFEPKTETTVALEDSIETQHEYATSSQEPPLTRYPKRLIEVDLPIKRISAHARREKSIRHGHISTLHIWWARRPLAACRAVLCAALWPDPADPTCPESFRLTARTLMQEWARNHKELLGKESFGRFVNFQRNPSELEDNEKLRVALLDFIADFANWDNSIVREYLDTSRALTQSAHEGLGGASGTRPLVVDPFAGGGSIPLEALRLGADAFASDLNPVPVLLNKVLLEYIPRYGQRLADEVCKWGEWIKDEAEKELAEFYPKDADGATPIAYLWARTIRCEGPGCGAEVPLINSLWLGKKPHNSWALRLVPDQEQRRIDFEIVRGAKPNEVGQGTVKRGSATCTCCGYTTPSKSVRKQLLGRHGGAWDARLLCVATTRKTEKGRFYRTATPQDFEVANKAKEKLEALKHSSQDVSLTPTEPTPVGGGKGAGRAFSQRNYGMASFEHLFTPRQLLTLITLLEKVKAARKEIEKHHSDGLAEAVHVALALNVDKMADYGSSLASWSSPASQETVRGTFSRQALSIVWDFAEAYPFASSSGGWTHNLNFLISPLESESQAGLSEGHVERASATSHPMPNDCADAFVTDPPYYDAIPYADLSDFFIVWLKRSLQGSELASNFASLSPKEEECVVDEVKGHDATFFEKTMGQALTEGRRLTRPGGVGIVVFAHKSTAGWEAQLQAMIDAGWIITGSWPIDTEREGRTRANSSAALASSVHLVCRPRENPDGSVRGDEIGDWRDVLQELPRRIHEWMPRLAEEGVVGADAIFACLGPALEVFSRYSQVEKASGEIVALKEYLESVWAAVAKEALTIIFPDADTIGFEEDARLTAMWLWTLSAGKSTSNGESNREKEADDESEGGARKAKPGGFVLEFDAARKIAQGLGAHLETLVTSVEVIGETARLLPVSERAQFLFGKQAEEQSTRQRRKKKPQIDLFDVGKSEDEVDGGLRGDFTLKTGETVLDRLHQSMILFGAGRSEALKRFLVEDGAGRDQRLWRLAQALAALYPTGTDERRWVEGVLARKRSLGF